jgi:hypothetical protein
MNSVIFCPPPLILGDHHSEPVAFNFMRSLSLKQPGPRDILMNARDDESSDDELSSVEDILEDVLGSKPDVIDLTFDSKLEESRP